MASTGTDSRFTVCVWSRLDGAWRTFGERGETFSPEQVERMRSLGWSVRSIPVDVVGPPSSHTQRLAEVERMTKATRRVCMAASDRAATLRDLQALRSRMAGAR